MKILFALPVYLFSAAAFPQLESIPVGKVTYRDLEMKSYPQDSSASAVILNEIGNAHLSNSDGNLIFERYLKIKIFNRRGFDEANFSIRLRKQGTMYETMISVVASTYNLINGSLKEIKLNPDQVYTENSNKYSDLKKFTLPDIREGSVIEIKYAISSPFLYDFRSWQFQSNIPKVHSEYHALIPGNYTYNIAWRGFLQPKSKSSVVKNGHRWGGQDVDCALYDFSLENIPAFVEEGFMTARANFASAVYFELSEVVRLDGQTQKFTKEWKDADKELRIHEGFGIQIRKAKNILEDRIKGLTLAEADELTRARAIYNFVKGWYSWNGNEGIVTELGVKKAYEVRKGNDADINLSLVGALQSAGLTAAPVILSTRENGLPLEVHPVINDFNYVIVAVNISGKQYLLDATRPIQPFGLIPMRCINGKGRLMDNVSTWIELKAREKQKTVIEAELSQTNDLYEGTLTMTYRGYDALNKRAEIISAGDQTEYVKRLKNKWKDFDILQYRVNNLDSLDNPLEEKMSVTLAGGEPGAGTIFFDAFLPFGNERCESNPFKSMERLYPVDFGAAREQTLVLKLRYLPAYKVDELPPAVGLNLPQGGGRYLFNVSNIGNEISITSSLATNKSAYSSSEYHYLKELFDRLVLVQRSQIVFKKK